jgi:hypothetical protein
MVGMERSGCVYIDDWNTADAVLDKKKMCKNDMETRASIA